MTETLKPFTIDWSSRSKLRGPGEQSLGKLLRGLRDRLAPDAQGMSLTYVDDRGMRKLNREHRGKNSRKNGNDRKHSVAKRVHPIYIIFRHPFGSGCSDIIGTQCFEHAPAHL